MSARAYAIVLAILVPVTMPQGGAVAVGCVEVARADFERVELLGPLLDLDGWDLAAGYKLDRLPETITLLAVQGDASCDLTHDLAGFLGPRAVPRDDADAVALAALAVEARFPEWFPDLEVRAARVEERGVDLTVWTPRHSVVAEARVELGGSLDVTFVVRATGEDLSGGEVEGWFLQAGMTEEDLEPEPNGGAPASVLLGGNADGSQWRITYDPARYVDEEQALFYAEMNLVAAQRAYANLTAWGFTSSDPDRVLDVRLDGCACILGSDDAMIRMPARANIILDAFPSLAYRSEAELTQVILGHELFHHMQWGVQRWAGGPWLLEGMARASETMLFPDATFLPTTLVYATSDNGMNGFLARPARSIYDHTYDWAIVWGYLAAHEGGPAFLLATLEESVGMTGDANVVGPAAIERAMQRVPGGEHETFVDAYRAFSDALLTHEGWTWGTPAGEQVHDWSTYFIPLARESNEGLHAVPGWGIQAHDAAPGPQGSRVVYTGGLEYDSVFYERQGDAVTIGPAGPATLVGGVDDAMLVVRNFAVQTAGAYGVIVSR